MTHCMRPCSCENFWKDYACSLEKRSQSTFTVVNNCSRYAKLFFSLPQRARLACQIQPGALNLFLLIWDWARLVCVLLLLAFVKMRCW